MDKSVFFLSANLGEGCHTAAARESEAVHPVAGWGGQGVGRPRLLQHAHVAPIRQRHQDTRAHVALHKTNT